MPHDGQDIAMTDTVILPDLLSLTGDAVPATEGLLARATEVVRDTVTADGKVSAGLLEANQTAAHGLAWLATYVESLRQLRAWADRLEAAGNFGESNWSHVPGKYTLYFSVHPEYGNRGIGTAVYEYIMDELAGADPDLVRVMAKQAERRLTRILYEARVTEIARDGDVVALADDGGPP